MICTFKITGVSGNILLEDFSAIKCDSNFEYRQLMTIKWKCEDFTNKF